MKCPACGAELSYNIKDEKVVCEYCKSVFNPQELEAKNKYANEREQFEGKSYNCHQCGATLLTFDETAITFCSYCGSQSIIESKMIKVNNPDVIIPFKITKEEAISSYKKMLKKSLFVPKYMKDEFTVEKFRGIFIPYVIYKTSLHGKCTNKGSKYSHRSGDYVYYDDYRIDANVDADYNGISFDLLSKFYDDFSINIPFNFNEAIEFNKNYLIGFYADTKDVQDDVYDEDARNISSLDASKYLKKRSEFHRYGCTDPSVTLDVSERKTGMFPVYFLAIRDKTNRLHYAVINGQTGRAVSELPIDFKKYLLSTLLLSIIIFLVLNAKFVIIPRHILIFSLILSVISLVVSISQLKKINEKENRLDDLGYLSKTDTDKMIDLKMKKNKRIEKKFSSKRLKISILLFILFALLFHFGINSNSMNMIFIVFFFGNFVAGFNIIAEIFRYFIDLVSNRKQKIKSNFKLKFKDIYKQIISIVVCAIVFYSYTYFDEPYYIASIFSLLMTIISFSDLIKEHNLLTSNKLSQLEKRGGEENEK